MIARWLQAVAILAIPLCTDCSRTSQSQLHAGEEVIAVDPVVVLEISYRSPVIRMIAHRWTVDDQFVLSFEKAEGQGFQRCQAPRTFEELLRPMTSLRAIRVLERSEAEQLLGSKPIGGWAEFAIRDNTDLEAVRLLVLPPAKPGDELFVRRSDSPEVITIDPRAFDLVTQGCGSWPQASSVPEAR